MNIPLILEILQAIQALSVTIPQVSALAQSGIAIANRDTITAEQEAWVRAQLDAVKAEIDAA